MDMKRRVVDSPWMWKGSMINVEAPMEPFGGIIQLEAKLVA
jgi:hypothetical protein